MFSIKGHTMGASVDCRLALYWQVSKSRGLVLLAVALSSLSFLSRTLDRTYEIEHGMTHRLICLHLINFGT